MLTKKYFFLLIVVLVFLGGVIVISMHYQKIQQEVRQEKQNREIVNFCEQYYWNDSRRNQDSWDYDGERLIGQHDFLCSEYTYLIPKVKKSSTGICHDAKSTYYYETKIYQVFDSMDDCLNSGGRKPYN